MNSEDKDRLWDEYKYRHQHVWATVFKLTAAVVLVSIVPYANREVACVLGWLAVAPPAVAIGLALFGYVRMKRELEILEDIRGQYREVQPLRIKRVASSFGEQVNRFLSLLVIAAIANALIVLLIWRPAVPPSRAGEPSSCFATPSSSQPIPAPKP